MRMKYSLTNAGLLACTWNLLENFASLASLQGQPDEKLSLKTWQKEDPGNSNTGCIQSR
jgi:hypothetical protein